MLGIAELVRLALFADAAGTIEVTDFEKVTPDTTTCSMVGRCLSYSATLEADGSLSLTVSNADCLDEPQRILHGVATHDWKTIGRTIAALEHSGVNSVAHRPVEVVDADGIKWVIA
jgi:hypothetical protein